MKNTNISFTEIKEASIKSIEIRIEGEASINCEQDVYQQFKSIIIDFDFFIFKLRNIEIIDLPFIQLLISIQKTINAEKKKISFDIELPENLLSIVEKSGFDIKNLLQK